MTTPTITWSEYLDATQVARERARMILNSRDLNVGAYPEWPTAKPARNARHLPNNYTVNYTVQSFGANLVAEVERNKQRLIESLALPRSLLG